jgi:hypothetical protein
MESAKIYLIVCLAIFFAFAIPAGLYFSLRRGKEAGAIDLMRHAVSRARHPWEDEDDALVELSRRVASLQESRRAEESPGVSKEVPENGQGEEEDE